MAKNNAINSPVLGGITAFTANGVLLGKGTNTIVASDALNADYKILSGDTTDGAPRVKTLTAGTNVTLATNSSTITINATGGGAGFTWSTITSATTLAVNTGYVAAGTANITCTLPSTAAVGSVIKIINNNNNYSVTIAQGSGQKIIFGNSATATGTGGSVVSDTVGDSLELVCIVANTTFAVVSSMGTFTVNQ